MTAYPNPSGRNENFKYQSLSEKKSSTYLTNLRETSFLFSYFEVEAFNHLIQPSNKINKVSKSDSSLSFNTKQSILGQLLMEF